MNCFECAVQDQAVTAVAICSHCGAGLCLEHLGDALTYRGGGTAFTCTHDLDRYFAARRAKETTKG